MIGCQEPAICNFPAYTSSSGAEAIELAALAGLYLDEWQQFVLTNALGERADKKWAAPTVGLVVGRQNGKNSILEARELIGLFLLGEKVIVHSAHEQATSSEHFRRLLELIESVPEFERRVLKAPKGKGAEAIELRGGQRVLFKTRTGGGGRGFSVDLLVFDEAMILSAGAKAALIPTMAARSIEGNTQTWYAGSAVDQLNPKHDGVELARVREQGIKGADRVAYFEWSVKPWDKNPQAYNPSLVPAEIASDPALWAQANPGLGIRISPEWIEHERTVELGEREFAVERLGIGDWPDINADGQVITVAQWAAIADPASEMVDPVCFGFDVSPSRTMASIVAAGQRADGLDAIEVIEHREGTGWLAAKLALLNERQKPAAILCSAAGAASSLIPELEDLGIAVIPVGAADEARACGLLYDAVIQRTVRQRNSEQIGAAVKGATKRPLMDSWAWNRKGAAADITPLVAGTLALWGANTVHAAQPWAAHW